MRYRKAKNKAKAGPCKTWYNCPGDKIKAIINVKNLDDKDFVRRA